MLKATLKYIHNGLNEQLNSIYESREFDTCRCLILLTSCNSSSLIHVYDVLCWDQTVDLHFHFPCRILLYFLVCSFLRDCKTSKGNLKYLSNDICSSYKGFKMQIKQYGAIFKIHISLRKNTQGWPYLLLPMKAFPVVTSVSPVNILKVVVLPAPFTPSRPKHCYGGNKRISDNWNPRFYLYKKLGTT